MSTIELIKKFESNFSPLPKREILYIVSEYTGISETELLFPLNCDLKKSDMSFIEKQLARRLAGEPLQYITGIAHFRNYEFHVGPAVLIPRPETELLVDEVIKKLKIEQSPSICDIGTGSGAIAISLALEIPKSQIVASDISEKALQYTRRNIEKYHLSDRITLLRSNLFESFGSDRFDLIAANLPYVAEAFYDELPDEVKLFEPENALFADDNGLALIKKCIEKAPDFLHSQGTLVLEISPEQTKQVFSILKKTGFYEVEVIRDLTGRERFCRASV